VVVIGGGNTAIDAAVQAKRLGAENVTLVYRRGADAMSATTWEQDLAAPMTCSEVMGDAIRFEKDNRRGRRGGVQKPRWWTASWTRVHPPADLVLKAIGREARWTACGSRAANLGDGNSDSLPVFAGGDCIQVRAKI